MYPAIFYSGRGMFDERKVAQAAAYFVAKEGGRMAHLKLMKLLYLADRESIKIYGLPISGDEYYSLPHGPVLSKTLELTNGAIESSEGGWSCWISDSDNYEVTNRQDAARPALDELSDADIEVLDKIWQQFGHMTRWQIRDYTHDKRHVPEWEDPEGSARPISLSKVMQAVGRSPDQIQNDLAQVKAHKQIEAVFASL